MLTQIACFITTTKTVTITPKTSTMTVTASALRPITKTLASTTTTTVSNVGVTQYTTITSTSTSVSTSTTSTTTTLTITSTETDSATTTSTSTSTFSTETTTTTIVAYTLTPSAYFLQIDPASSRNVDSGLRFLSFDNTNSFVYITNFDDGTPISIDQNGHLYGTFNGQPVYAIQDSRMQYVILHLPTKSKTTAITI